MPRALPEALLEGLAWDAVERRYATLSEVRDYSARVASAVGAMMCVLMRARDPDALARACDLGVAMQLTNIARDVGEDARAGRIYLPTDWLDEAGISVDDFFANPAATPEIRRMVRRLLAEAQRLYIRSEAGIRKLPMPARTGIFAARYIYAGIAASVRRNAHDTVTVRARTTKAAKVGLIGKAAVRSAVTVILPQSPVLFARPLDEVAFLVDAAAVGASTQNVGAGAALAAVMSTLQA